jgi:hypothetical protein
VRYRGAASFVFSRSITPGRSASVTVPMGAGGSVPGPPAYNRSAESCQTRMTW